MTVTANTAFGLSALQNNTTGSNNTASGVQALFTNSTGSYNTASGYFALDSNTTGSQNSASGFQALAFNSTGFDNTASGFDALYHATTGSYNTATGFQALYVNSTGSHNIALGDGAGSSITGSNNIDIGNSGFAAENGAIRLGANSTQKATFIAGIYDNKVITNALPVYVNSNGRLSVGSTSSERYKTDIAPMGKNIEKLQMLRPVTFHLKSEPNGVLQYGLIAEEVDNVYPELVIRDDKGKI